MFSGAGAIATTHRKQARATECCLRRWQADRFGRGRGPAARRPRHTLPTSSGFEARSGAATWLCSAGWNRVLNMIGRIRVSGRNRASVLSEIPEPDGWPQRAAASEASAWLAGTGQGCAAAPEDQHKHLESDAAEKAASTDGPTDNRGPGAACRGSTWP